ncbi:unnamed protein product [Coffea canephora]|uniref:DH200=94 genomic scaffold, scaffold_819 n=1 Tax=Coffea canephora TaxID=49390 RepID=A0A068VH06_COFCA|nr:unnamed protein product [Coffea canephora]
MEREKKERIVQFLAKCSLQLEMLRSANSFLKMKEQSKKETNFFHLALKVCFDVLVFSSFFS